MSISLAQPISQAHAATADANRRQKPAVRRHRRGKLTCQRAVTTSADLARLDHAAAQLGVVLGPVRLAFGDALNALDHKHGYHQLGFASLSTYAAEHAGKPKRWVTESRTLAGNLEQDSTLRRQLASGRLTWTRAELLARLVQHSLIIHDITNSEAARALRPALEMSWLFKSSGSTCRELGEQLRSLDLCAAERSTMDRVRYLTLTLPSEDTGWFHAAERTFRRVAERTDLDAFLEALLAETQNTLQGCPSIPGNNAGLEASDRWHRQLAQWRTQAEHRCERARPSLPRAERGAGQPPGRAWPRPRELRTWSVSALHEYICTLAKQLHLNAAALGRSAEQLHHVQAWRRLGFASAGHYARDRLGVSHSSLKQQRALARRLSALPKLAHALEAGRLGSVAAALVARVATKQTEQRWVERARQRTVKHLREEVAFVERILRARPGHRGWPPAPEIMRAEHALRGAIANSYPSPRPPVAEGPPIAEGPASSHRPTDEQGRQRGSVEQQRRFQQEVHNYAVGTDVACSREQEPVLLAAPGAVPQSADCPSRRAPQSCGPWVSPMRPYCADSRIKSATSAVAAARQTSDHGNSEKSHKTACARESRTCTSDPTGPDRGHHRHVPGDGLGIGRVRLRFRIYESTLLLYRDVGRMFARQHPERSLLRSLCEHFLMVWGPVVARRHAHKYDHIYERDGYECTSPVCDRHDVTPHHLKFRSRGGGDEAANLTSLCVWCHLEGVHGGRIRAEPKPDGIHWTIGRIAPIRVRDRDKQPQKP